MREETIMNNSLLSVNIIGGALITNFIDKCKTETECFRQSFTYKKKTSEIID